MEFNREFETDIKEESEQLNRISLLVRSNNTKILLKSNIFSNILEINI